MRILHLDSERTWRGGQNQTRMLIRGLAEKGVHQYLAAPEDSAMLHAMKDEIECMGLPFKRGLDVSTISRLAAFCRDSQIDLIDAQSSKAHHIGLLAIRKNPYCKMLVHRRVDYQPSHHPFNWYKYFHPKVSRYVCISEAIGRIMRGYGVPERKISVVRSCTSDLNLPYSSKAEAKAALCKELKFPEDTVLIGNASALTSQKDYPMLLEALSLLRHKNVKFRALIAGDGPLKTSLEDFVKTHSLGRQVKFLGFREDVAAILQGLDILSVSSRFEGLGTIILDGLQAKCCVVATEVGGIPEMIIHESTGLLSPIENAEAFAANLKRAIESKEERVRFADMGHDLVSERFSFDKMVSGNHRAYKEILSPD